MRLSLRSVVSRGLLTWLVIPAAMIAAPAASAPEPRRDHAAVFLSSGDALFAGGERGDHVLAQAEVWRRLEGRFVTVGTMAVPRAGHTATLLRSGTVLVTGGRNASGPLASTELYDSQSFRLGPALQRARHGHAALLLEDGRVVLLGGDAEGTVEILDPVTGESTLLASRLASARSRHAAIALDAPTILVAGGVVDGAVSRTAEIFSINAGSLVPEIPMGAARTAPRLRRLSDGIIQVSGGDGEESIEVFNSERHYFTAV